MQDIETRADIDLLMSIFYQQAMADEVIGQIFTDANLDLEHHLPIIGDFWEGVVFGAAAYAGRGRNPLEIHKQLDVLSPLKPKHFERWLQIFTWIVDTEFSGERADMIKMRARSIASRMQEFLSKSTEAESSMDRAVNLPLHEQ